MRPASPFVPLGSGTSAPTRPATVRHSPAPTPVPTAAPATAPAAALAPTTAPAPTPADVVRGHLAAVGPSLRSLESSAGRLAAWGTGLAARLMSGQRLLAAGNGGSAAEAQHLTAELVGRFDGEREAFSAISLHAETSAVTAIANDYGYDEVFARQVRGHGRAGDVLLLLTTSGRSPNLVRAAEAARELGIATWALTGSIPNPLAGVVDECVGIEGAGANVQECHLIAVHALCRAFDAEVARLRSGETPRGSGDGVGNGGGNGGGGDRILGARRGTGGVR